MIEAETSGQKEVAAKTMKMVQPRPVFWGDKRYHAFNWHLRQEFGAKVVRVALDGGFTCPNRDGTLGTGGCAYCSGRGSGDFAGMPDISIHAQFEQIRSVLAKKWPRAKYLAYFQAFTNTYAPVSRLREVYTAALNEPDVVGLAVATRPDCLPMDVLDYLSELNRQTYLWVELGLQTIHASTLTWIGRGHTYAQFLAAVQELRERGIRVCTHIILGLPGETREAMLRTAEAVAALPVQGLKIHLLHVLRATRLASEFAARPFPLLERDEYVRLVVDVLELLPPDMIIHRLTGDGPPDDLIAPLWSRKKWEVLNAIDAELARRDSWQGKRRLLPDRP